MLLRPSDTLSDIELMMPLLDQVRAYSAELLKEKPWEAAQKKGTYFDEVSGLARWIDAAPNNCKDVAVMPAFNSFEKYISLIQVTSSYEIGLSYVAKNSHVHRYAGIGGITKSQTDREIPFLTVYGHADQGCLKDSRTHRVFTDPQDITSILQDIGVLSGSGHLVVTKGDEKSVCSYGWINDFNALGLVFGMHTHPKGVDNYTPSTEECNALNNPKGGDFASLESRIHAGVHSRRDPVVNPLYLSLTESKPSADIFEF